MINICRVFPQYRKPGLRLAKASLHAFATLMGTAEAQDARLPAHAPERNYKTCYVGLLENVRHHLEHCIVKVRYTVNRGSNTDGTKP